MKKIYNWIINIIFGLLIVLVVLTLIGKLSKSDTIFGFTPLKVLSGSMEPAIKTGDLIIIKDIDESNIKTGDVITFKTDSDTFVTHRVIGVSNENGKPRFKTKGDANNVEDEDLISGNDVVGKYIFRIPRFGYFSDLIIRPTGFLLFFIFPIIILLGKEIVNFNKAWKS